MEVCAEWSMFLGSSFIEYDFNKLLLPSAALIARVNYSTYSLSLKHDRAYDSLPTNYSLEGFPVDIVFGNRIPETWIPLQE